jgi:predicted DNA-binding protein with PD1-like motif
MHRHQLTAGRTFGIRFDPGESFFPALGEFCADQGIRQGYIPGADRDRVGLNGMSSQEYVPS